MSKIMNNQFTNSVQLQQIKVNNEINQYRYSRSDVKYKTIYSDQN